MGEERKQTAPNTISTSQINCFATCPRKFQFQYIKRMKPVLTSGAMNTGLEIHKLIAEGIFDHPNDDMDAMLKIAKEYLIPYKDSNEKCFTEHKLKGKICNKNAVGIYDKIWPSIGKAIDWKSGSNAPYKKRGHDIQAYIYTMLFEQNFNRDMEEILFVFFGDGSVYSPPVQDDKFRSKCEKYIQGIIDSAYLSTSEFPKKISPLCGWCGFQPICEMFE